jgi:hypothetical protein
VTRSAAWRSAAVNLALLAAAALVTGIAHAHMATPARAQRGETFVPRPDRARLGSLGFEALVADFYWLLAVQVVGGATEGLGHQAGLLGRLIDVTTTVDPWVDHPYRFAAVWLTDSEESVRTANRLLERGIAYHPDDWRDRYHLGFNYFFYLEDNDRAADVLEGALGLKGAPSYLGGLVARLRADRDGLETAAAFLVDMARNSEDPYARAGYLKALDEVVTERAARHLDAARTEYWRRHGRDIERVGDLLAGPHPVLRRLPPAHPHFGADFEWILDPASGQIVSSFYGKRYGVHIHPLDAERRERWKAERKSGRPEGGA